MNTNQELIDQVNQHILLIKSIIAVNSDRRTKEVGDRVVIWDGSGNIDKNTGKSRCGIDPLFTKSKAIVVAINQNIIYSDPFMNNVLEGNYDKVCDLLLKFPSGEEIYCCSDFVRIVD